jgi:alpha-tubulin suppressor-like RCC1 family protein
MKTHQESEIRSRKQIHNPKFAAGRRQPWPTGNWPTRLFSPIATLLLAVAVLAGAPKVFAVANDNFADALVITTIPYSNSSSNVDATRESGEPYHYGSINGHSVWWTWMAPASGPMQVNSTGSAIRSVIAVYTGSSVSALTQVSAGRGNHIVDFAAVAGTTYQIALDSLDAGVTGNFTFRLLSGVTPPGNDPFTNATVITGASCAFTGLTNAGATKEPGEPAHAGNLGGKSVWWTWTAPASGPFKLDTAGSALWNLLAVYTGSSVTNLTPVVSNNTYSSGSNFVTFTALGGTNYWFVVDGWEGREGSFNLNLTPPSNDYFAFATVISGSSYGTNGVYNTNATKEAGEPNHAGNSGGKSLWWDWTAPTNGSCHVDTFGSTFNTLLAVYTGSPVSGLTTIASNDDSPTNPPASELTFHAVSGTTYHIAVDGYNGASGSITMNLVQTPDAVPSGAETVAKIAAGGSHSLFLKSDGSLWGMGYNGFGQLGDGTPTDVHLPKPVVFGNNTTIAGGGFHSLFLKSGGSLWAMGRNVEGQLGDGTSNPSNNIPEQIVAGGVTAISAGTRHSLFLKSDGSLWAMGQNSFGQLGDGTLVNTNLPEQIVAGGVTNISAGFWHSLFIKTNGSLWAMGGNSSGQLGDGTLANTNLPEQIVASNVTAIAAGVNFSLFLKSDGSLWAMGLNTYGQLGDGTYNNTNRPEQIVASGVTAIAAGSGYSMFLKSDGSLWGMGVNSWGQLGDGTYNNTNLPERIVAGNVTAISVGYQHSLFIKSDGSLWAMGYQAMGQLGDGYYGNTYTNLPEQIVAPPALPPGYNQITGQLLGGTNMQLSFLGDAVTKYALDRSFNLSPADWIPQATNFSDSGGALMFTNTPDATTNNFWRIRSVP